MRYRPSLFLSILFSRFYRFVIVKNTAKQEIITVNSMSYHRLVSIVTFPLQSIYIAYRISACASYQVYEKKSYLQSKTGAIIEKQTGS